MIIPFKVKQGTAKEVNVLAGDVGATKSYFALCKVSGDKVTILKEEKYVSASFKHLTEMVTLFLEDQQLPEVIAIGVAGPVENGKVVITNLSWSIDQTELAAASGVENVQLINDLEATAYGLAVLSENDIETIYSGDINTPDKNNIAIIAPGTGLGEAGLFWDGQSFNPFATEGGHCDFSPRKKIDLELFNYLQDKFGHVSWERVLSGPGIYSIYQFLHTEKQREQPEWLAEKIAQENPAMVISNAAISKQAAICIEAMELFIHYLAVESANLILKLKATGGLFIGGGIAPKIKELLNPEIFTTTFDETGRLNHLLKKVPIRLILNDKAALLGAAYYGGTCFNK